MRVLLLLYSSLVALPLFAKPPIKTHPCLQAKNPVCGNIVKLSPTINKDFALKISNDFVHISRSYQLPVQLLISIAKQESNFRLEVVRMVKGLLLDDGEYKPSAVGSDFCMMQINVANILRLNLDPHRLITDSRYCIEAGAKILTSVRKHHKTEPTWWTRYNAVSDMHRKIYQEHVLRHWRKLDPAIDDKTCQMQMVSSK